MTKRWDCIGFDFAICKLSCQQKTLSLIIFCGLFCGPAFLCLLYRYLSELIATGCGMNLD